MPSGPSGAPITGMTAPVRGASGGGGAAGSAGAAAGSGGGGGGSAAAVAAKATAAPAVMKPSAAMFATAMRFRFKAILGLDGFGDAVVGDYVIGVGGGACQGGVGAQEGLAYAAVDFDVGVLEGDAHGRGFEGLLVDGDGGDLAGFGVDFDGPRHGEGQAGGNEATG